MAVDRRYFSSLLFRLTLAVLAMMLSARAICALEGDAKAWFLAGLFGLSAAALQIRPLLVPNPGRGSSVYSPGLAFFIAGLYLIPAGPLVACIAFAIALAGIVKGTRPHKILLQLSATVLAFGACSYFMKLGPRSGDPPVPPPELIAVEIFLGVVVLFAQLVLRSVAIRLERGHDAPHWGAFQPSVMLESAYCLALAVPISVLTRIHLALLAVVYLYVGFTWWVMDRYRQHLRVLGQVSKPAPVAKSGPVSRTVPEKRRRRAA